MTVMWFPERIHPEGQHQNFETQDRVEEGSRVDTLVSHPLSRTKETNNDEGNGASPASISLTFHLSPPVYLLWTNKTGCTHSF